MSKTNLLWLLFSCTTFVGMAVAGMQGFYGLLLHNDVTYLGLSVCALYVATTLGIGWGLLHGREPGDFTWYLVEVIERAGLTGTCIGLVIVFFSVLGLDISSPEFKTAIVHGVITKLLCSVCGLVGWFFLSMQLKIIERRT